MHALVLLLAVPSLELAVDHPGTPEAALVVRVRNPGGHRPIALLREFWKFSSIQCTLAKDGQPVAPVVALKPDRPTLAQIVVLEPATEYGERLSLSHLWGTLTSGSYHAECRVGRKIELAKVYEASIHGGARRAVIGLVQDLRRVDLTLADLLPAAVDFKIP